MCNNTIPIVKLSSWKIQDEWTKASSCSLWFLSSSGQAPQGVTNHPQIEVSGRRRRRSLWGEGGSYIPAKKIRWFYGINNAIYCSQTSWFMTFELDLKFGFTFFWIYLLLLLMLLKRHAASSSSELSNVFCAATNWTQSLCWWSLHSYWLSRVA